MTDPDFRRLVRLLREWQRRYFDKRDRESLMKAKDLERRVDRELEQTPPSLFPPKEN